MPYVLQNADEAELQDSEVIEMDVALPPEAAVVQNTTSVIAATLRALGAQKQAGGACTPCEKKKRLQRLMALRQRG